MRVERTFWGLHEIVLRYDDASRAPAQAGPGKWPPSHSLGEKLGVSNRTLYQRVARTDVGSGMALDAYPALYSVSPRGPRPGNLNPSRFGSGNEPEKLLEWVSVATLDSRETPPKALRPRGASRSARAGNRTRTGDPNLGKVAGLVLGESGRLKTRRNARLPGFLRKWAKASERRVCYTERYNSVPPHVAESLQAPHKAFRCSPPRVAVPCGSSSPSSPTRPSLRRFFYTWSCPTAPR